MRTDREGSRGRRQRPTRPGPAQPPPTAPRGGRGPPRSGTAASRATAGAARLGRGTHAPPPARAPRRRLCPGAEAALAARRRPRARSPTWRRPRPRRRPRARLPPRAAAAGSHLVARHGCGRARSGAVRETGEAAGAEGRGQPLPATAALASCISAPLPRSTAPPSPAPAQPPRTCAPRRGASRELSFSKLRLRRWEAGGRREL